MDSDITLKIPDAQPYVLRTLYTIRDALQRESYRECRLLCNDCLVKVQNELDWSYQTDTVLPFIREFLLELVEALNTRNIGALRAQIISTIDSTVQEVTQVSNALATWNAPDKHLDLLEIEHKNTLYLNE